MAGKKIRVQWDVKNQELEQSEKQWKDIQRAAGMTEEEIEKVNKELKGTQQETKKAKSGFEQMGETLGKLGIAALVAAGAAAFVDLTKEINKARREAALLTGETGRSLDNLVAKIRATSKVFDKEYNEVLRAANTLSKEFGITMLEAVDQVNKGFVRGADINGEYLETLKEYSSQVQSAGLDVEQFNQLIQTSVQEGIFSDKGLDVVKEGMLRIREMTVATKEALARINIDGDEMQERLRTGQITLFEAIQEVSEGLGDVSEQSAETGTILADVFGGPGEDAGIRFVKLLADIDGEFDELNDTQAEYVKEQEQLLEAQERLEGAFVSIGTAASEMWRDLKDNAIPTLASFFELFVDHQDTVERLSNKTYQEFANKSTADVILAISDLNSELEQNKKWFEETDVVGQRMSGTHRNSKKRIVELNDQIKVLNEILEKRRDDFGKDREEQNEWTGEIDLSTEAVKELKMELDDFDKQVADIYESLFEKKDEFDLSFLGTPEELEQEQKDAEDQTDFIVDQIKRRVDAERFANEEKKRMGMEAAAALFSFQQNRLEAELEENRRAQEVALSQVEGNEKKEKEVKDKFAREEAKIKEKQARLDKNQALFNIAIDTAQNIVKYLGNPVLVALAVTVGALQAAAVAAKPIPKFEKGKIGIRGKRHNEGGILAEIEDQESVINRKATMKSPKLLHKINSLQLDDSVLEKLNQGRGDVVVNVDNNQLAELMKDRPNVLLNFDEFGFSRRIQTNTFRSTQQHRRFFG